MIFCDSWGGIFSGMTRSPLRYFGSKTSITEWLFSLFPAHESYIEPFGGSAAVLLAKAPAKFEVYNDVNSEVVNLFRIMRHPRLAARLAAQVELSPYSREEFELANGGGLASPIERARRLLLSSRMRVHASNSAGFRWGVGYGHRYCAEWDSVPDMIMNCAKRLKNVVVENLSWEQLIPHYDIEGAFIYCDPPYPAATRKGGEYDNEMRDEDHVRFCALLNGLNKAQWAVSSYDNDIYNKHLNFKAKYTKQAHAHMSGARTEVLYTSYAQRNLL